MSSGAANPSPPNASLTIAGSSTPIAIYGNGVLNPVASVTIKGNTIAPDSTLELDLLCNFPLPNNGGRSLSISLGAATMLQSFPGATMGGLSVKHSFRVAPDLQSLWSFSVNANDVLSPAAGQGAPFCAHTAAKTSIAVDLTQDQTLLIKLGPVSGDTAELTGWSLVNHRISQTPTKSFAPANATAAFGDSLTAGTGSVSPPGGWPAQLAIMRPGQNITNLGVAGQTSAQIAARTLIDKVRGKFWQCVFAMGRNDVGAPNLTALVTGSIAAAVANLSAGVKYLICTVTPAANEGPATANWNAIVALNAAINAAYGAKVADVFAALTGNGANQIATNLRAITATTTATYASGATSLSVASATGVVNGIWIDGPGI
jgi:lysophospholipase L1-like esterase